jgi:hypothetical protein
MRTARAEGEGRSSPFAGMTLKGALESGEARISERAARLSDPVRRAETRPSRGSARARTAHSHARTIPELPPAQRCLTFRVIPLWVELGDGNSFQDSIGVLDGHDLNPGQDDIDLALEISRAPEGAATCRNCAVVSVRCCASTASQGYPPRNRRGDIRTPEDHLPRKIP